MESFRATLTIPKNVARSIEKIIQYRIDNHQDEDEIINRNGVALEMLKIGAIVLEKNITEDKEVQKAYSKEFQLVVKLLLLAEHFSRVAATNSGDTDYITNSPELEELRKQFGDVAVNLLP